MPLAHQTRRSNRRAASQLFDRLLHKHGMRFESLEAADTNQVIEDIFWTFERRIANELRRRKCPRLAETNP